MALRPFLHLFLHVHFTFPPSPPSGVTPHIYLCPILNVSLPSIPFFTRLLHLPLFSRKANPPSFFLQLLPFISSSLSPRKLSLSSIIFFMYLLLFVIFQVSLSIFLSTLPPSYRCILSSLPSPRELSIYLFLHVSLSFSSMLPLSFLQMRLFISSFIPSFIPPSP